MKECKKSTSHKVQRSPQLTKSMITRLNRVEGQVKAIRKMVEDEIYCDDILTQISAAQSALNGVAKLLLENHLKTCLPNRIQDGDLEVIDEVMKTIGRLL